MNRVPPGVRRRGTRYQARWRDGDGTQRSATFDTPLEAYGYLSAAVETERPVHSVTVGEWAPEWRAAAPGRPSTLARDDSYLRAHVLPRWTDVGLADISTWDVQQWIQDLGTGLVVFLWPSFMSWSRCRA